MSMQTRSGLRAVAQCDLWPELVAHAVEPMPTPVGGRHRSGRPGRGGGGYLSGRTASELAADPRLRELAEIGLAAHWLEVARVIGYDQFVTVWRLLSSRDHLRNDDQQIELTLRPFRSYERYQRNRYVEQLALSGLRSHDIRDLLRRELGEQLSPRRVRFLVFEAKKRQGMGESASESQQCGPDPGDRVAA